ncbi:hypothetical protein [Aquamicrobium defluvii]|uniref:hypothetical protein n=1 Tax=Aquamicrobium defluvii TaxID=69279 RepID=UPI00105D3562|nr:hypothetical protein [Aquamicrobium defluvii]
MWEFSVMMDRRETREDTGGQGRMPDFHPVRPPGRGRVSAARPAWRRAHPKMLFRALATRSVQPWASAAVRGGKDGLTCYVAELRRACFAVRAGTGGEFLNFHLLQGSFKIFGEIDCFFPKEAEFYQKHQ